jgi:hypothetical protein
VAVDQVGGPSPVGLWYQGAKLLFGLASEKKAKPGPDEVLQQTGQWSDPDAIIAVRTQIENTALRPGAPAGQYLLAERIKKYNIGKLNDRLAVLEEQGIVPVDDYAGPPAPPKPPAPPPAPPPPAKPFPAPQPLTGTGQLSPVPVAPDNVPDVLAKIRELIPKYGAAIGAAVFGAAVPKTKPAPRPPKRSPKRTAPPKRPVPRRAPPKTPVKPPPREVPIKFPKAIPKNLPFSILERTITATKRGMDEAIRRANQRAMQTAPPKGPQGPRMTSSPVSKGPKTRPVVDSRPKIKPKTPAKTRALEEKRPQVGNNKQTGNDKQTRPKELAKVRQIGKPLPSSKPLPKSAKFPSALEFIALGLASRSRPSVRSSFTASSPGIQPRPPPGGSPGKPPLVGKVTTIEPLRAPQEELAKCWTQCRKAGPAKKRKKRRVCVTPAKAVKLGLRELTK